MTYRDKRRVSCYEIFSSLIRREIMRSNSRFFIVNFRTTWNTIRARTIAGICSILMVCNVHAYSSCNGGGACNQGSSGPTCCGSCEKDPNTGDYWCDAWGDTTNSGGNEECCCGVQQVTCGASEAMHLTRPGPSAKAMSPRQDKLDAVDTSNPLKKIRPNR